MSSRKLRKQLNNILKEKGWGKLYTCHKRQAFKSLTSDALRSMILFFENVKPGLQVNEWGINHTVIEDPVPVWCNVSHGGFYYKIDQIKYTNNYHSCGCGDYSCFAKNYFIRSIDNA